MSNGDSIWTGAFWKSAAERAVRATAFAASGVIASAGTGLIETDWLGVVSTAGMAGVLSVLFSIGGNAATGNGPALVAPETVDNP